MVAVSLVAAADLDADERRKRAVCRNDHDQARREDRKPKLAMSRTEPISVLPFAAIVAHASVTLAADRNARMFVIPRHFDRHA